MTYTFGTDALAIHRPYTPGRRTINTKVDSIGLISRTELPTAPIESIDAKVLAHSRVTEQPLSSPQEALDFAMRVAANIMFEDRREKSRKYTLPRY